MEQKTRELAATLSREVIVAWRNQVVLNSIADGVIVFDEHNIAILANPALSRLTEIPIENLVNRSVVHFILNESLSSSRTSLQTLFESPEEITTGIRVNWASKTLSASIARVYDTHNKNIGTVAVFRDITREVELERMKDTFMGVVSHELRTPLNAILGYAEMLKEGVYGAINEKQIAVAQRVMNSLFTSTKGRVSLRRKRSICWTGGQFTKISPRKKVSPTRPGFTGQCQQG